MREAMEAGDDLPPGLMVELVDNELARVYMNSATAQREHPTMPVLARQALGLARRLQDPALEFAAAHNLDEDLLCLQLHPNQNMVCPVLSICSCDNDACCCRSRRRSWCAYSTWSSSTASTRWAST